MRLFDACVIGFTLLSVGQCGIVRHNVATFADRDECLRVARTQQARYSPLSGIELFCVQEAR